MALIWRWQEQNQDLFTFLPADKLNIHDKIIDRVFLKLLPSYINPNHITLIRVLLTPFVFWLIFNHYYHLGIVTFLLAALTDVLDGSLARTRNQITKFGVLFDPLADKLLIGSMVLLLVFRYLHPWLAVTVIGMEIFFIIGALVASVKFKTVRMANLWGKIKMILQVMAVFIILLGLVFDNTIFFTFASWLFGLVIGFAILSLFTYGI